MADHLCRIRPTPDTGAAGGIGFATAKAFAEAGADVVLTNNSSRLNRLHLAWDIGRLPADDLGPAPCALARL
jgi:NAD(P)-dependent dehydrogenase (short-subunit alcohol dehydrogenase family)